MSDIVLVVGGTGFIGREVARQCLEAGHRVRILARRPERAADLARPGTCELVRGDVLDPASLSPAMEGVTALIHCVGALFETQAHTFEDIHVRGAANVAQAAREAGIRRVLLISAQGVRLVGRSRYHISKMDGELTFQYDHFDWTFLRPTLVYGRGDRFLSELARWMRRPRNPAGLLPLPLPENGMRWVQPVRVEEVAQCCVRALANPATIHQILFVTGPKAMHWRDLVVAVGTAAGIPVVYESWPWRTAFRLLAWVLLVILPPVWLALAACGCAGLPLLIALAALWLAAADLALFWRRVVAFSVPLPLLWAAALAADAWLPRPLRFGEQLKLAEENNEADPTRASKMLRYKPMPLDEGLRRMFRS